MSSRIVWFLVSATVAFLIGYTVGDAGNVRVIENVVDGTGKYDSEAYEQEYLAIVGVNPFWPNADLVNPVGHVYDCHRYLLLDWDTPYCEELVAAFPEFPPFWPLD